MMNNIKLITELIKMLTPERVDDLNSKLEESGQLYHEDNYEIGIVFKAYCYKQNLRSSQHNSISYQQHPLSSTPEKYINDLSGYIDKYWIRRHDTPMQIMLFFSLHMLLEFRLETDIYSIPPNFLKDSLKKIKRLKELENFEFYDQIKDRHPPSELYELAFKCLTALDIGDKKEAINILNEYSSLKNIQENFKQIHSLVCLTLSLLCEHKKIMSLHYERLKKEFSNDIKLLSNLFPYALYLRDIETLEEIVNEIGKYSFLALIEDDKVKEQIIVEVKRIISQYRSLSNRKLIETNKIIARFRKLHHIVTQSLEMAEVFQTIEEVADSDIKILITGETGTGKELIAAAIHRESNRKNQKFVPVNAAAIPDDLIESEFFGHKKGAFTGASQDKVGLIQSADKGTLFIDEVTEMSQKIQAKMLRAFQEHEIKRLGDTKSIKVDFRLITATNKDIQVLVENDKFREDMMYRINERTISLPPLSDRPEDIPLIADYYYKIYRDKYQSDNNFDPPIKDFEILKSREWPGNIRQLQSVIHNTAVALKHISDLNRSKFLKVLKERADISSGFDLMHENFENNSSLLKDNVRLVLETYFANELNVTKTKKAIKKDRNTVTKRVNTAFIIYANEYGEQSVDMLAKDTFFGKTPDNTFMSKLRDDFDKRINSCIDFAKLPEDDRPKTWIYYQYCHELVLNLIDPSK